MSASGEGVVLDRNTVLSFEVGDSWSVADLRRFLEAVSEIYDLFLLGSLRRSAGRQGYAGIALAARTEPTMEEAAVQVGSVFGEPLRLHLPTLTPEAGGERYLLIPTETGSAGRLPLASLVDLDQVDPDLGLQVERIEMASPGTIDLKGIGEPIEQARELIKDVSTIDVNRKQRKAALAKMQEENRHQAAMNEIEEENARMEMAGAKLDLFERTMALTLGPNWRETEVGQAKLKALLASMGVIDELTEQGKLALPPGIGDAA